MTRINPEVLDRAMERTGSTSYEQLGQVFLTKTGTTLRNWRDGKTAPDLASLMKLQKLTGYSLDQMVIKEAA